MVETVYEFDYYVFSMHEVYPITECNWHLNMAENFYFHATYYERSDWLQKQDVPIFMSAKLPCI